MRKTTLGRELWALNGKKMTMGHKWKTSLGVSQALNEKNKTLGHK